MPSYIGLVRFHLLSQWDNHSWNVWCLVVLRSKVDMQLLDFEVEAWRRRYFNILRLLRVIETCQRYMWVEFLTMITLVNRVIGEGGR